MASVYKKGANWYARYKDAAGRWRHKKLDARTKRDAERDADDLGRKAQRQRAGLEPLPVDGPAMTFKELLTWWSAEYGSKRRSDPDSFARKHLLPSLGRLALVEVPSARIEATLQSLTGTLSAKSLHMLRGVVHVVFAKAIKRALWQGLNPAIGVDRRKVSRPIYETLRAGEATELLTSSIPNGAPCSHAPCGRACAKASCSAYARRT